MDGRTADGKFSAGNQAAAGVDRKGFASKWREAVLRSGSEEDIEAAMRELYKQGMGSGEGKDAKPGDWKAIVAWLNLLGCRGDAIDMEERIGALEEMLEEQLGGVR